MGTNRLRQFGARIHVDAAAVAKRLASAPPLPLLLRHGVNAATLLLQDDPARHATLEAGMAWLATDTAPGEGIDQIPHDIMRALVLHLHLATFLERYESLPPRLWGACEYHLPNAVLPCRRVERFSDTTPDHESVDQALWDALCLHDQARALGRDVDTEMVDGVVHHAVMALEQDPVGLGNPPTPMVQWRCLHPLANLALDRRNRTWARAVRDVALALGPNAAPPHPWALFALAWSTPTAELTFRTQPNATPADDAATLMLLADAATAVRCFEP